MQPNTNGSSTVTDYCAQYSLRRLLHWQCTPRQHHDMSPAGFGSLGLDARLLQGIKKKGYKKPTRVQSVCVPALLKGKDVVAIAKTGTGKTMAYLLPLVNGILAEDRGTAGWEALILTPTRELCLQVRDEVEELISHCNIITKATAMNPKDDDLPMIVKSAGSIVVATPGQMLKVLELGCLDMEELQRLKMLVVDEADLLMSYGYEKDISTLAPKIPRSCQCVLVSATKAKELSSLEKLLLHNPVHLDLIGQQSKENALESVDHMHVACFDEDRMLCLLVLLKMNVVQRKVLIFVNSITWAYKTRLFLEAFGVRGVVLHAELPLNSRHHILKQFNKGRCQHMIVADDTHSAPRPQQLVKKKRKRELDAKTQVGNNAEKKDEEFGVTRGLDFQGVSTVVNLELPDSPEGYTHRVGRTGRGGENGTALTFLTPADAQFKAQINQDLKKRNSVEDDEEDMFKPLAAPIAPHMEGLRARCEDVLRGVTKQRIKQARVEDLRNELLNSEKLESHFASHPNDVDVLKHDATMASTRNSPHLKNALPDYICVPDLMTTTHAKVVSLGKKLKDDPLKLQKRMAKLDSVSKKVRDVDMERGGISAAPTQRTVGSKRRR